MYDKNSLHFRGPNEQFGTHEKLSWECELGQISPQVILICNKLERFIYINNTYMNCFKSGICSVPYTSVWLRAVITWIDNIAYYI